MKEKIKWNFKRRPVLETEKLQIDLLLNILARSKRNCHLTQNLLLEF